MIERLKVGPIGENVYILPFDTKSDLDRPGSACVLVDPGDAAERILAVLDRKQLKVRCIALTHGHLDHISAIPALFAAWEKRGESFEAAPDGPAGQTPGKPLHHPPLAIHSADAAYLGPSSEETNRRTFMAIGAIGFFKNYAAPMPPADILLKDGGRVAGSMWRVIYSPGHSAGSICLYCPELGVLVSGDTLFRDGFGRTDGPDSDSAALERSIGSAVFPLPAETIVLPGHGEPTTIGRERDNIDNAEEFFGLNDD